MKSGSCDLDSATKRKGPIPQSPRADPKTVCAMLKWSMMFSLTGKMVELVGEMVEFVELSY